MIALTVLLVRARWRSYLVVAWLAAMMGGLAVAGVLHPLSIANRVASDEMRAVPLSARSLIVSQTSIESDFTDLVGRARVMPRFTVTYTEQVTVTGDGVVAALLIYRDGFCAHVRMVSGRCPVSTGEVALPDQIARNETGAQIALSHAKQSIDGWIDEGLGAHPVGVVGRYVPLDPTEEYWGARRYFTDTHDVLAWPILAVPETLRTIPHPTTARSLDLLPDRDLILSGDYQAVRNILADARVGEPNTGLKQLMERIAAKRAYTRVMTPVVVLPVMAIGLWALLIVVGAHMQRDRLEVGVQALRGLPGLRRWWLMMGAPAAIVAVMVPAGAVAVSIGWGRSSGAAVTAALYATLAALAVVAVAALPLIRSKVTDVLRTVPPRRGATAPLFEVGLAAVAGAALVQLRSGDRSGLGLYAATLIAAATAVLVARVVPIAVRPLASRAIRRGRIILGVGLALFSRRGSGRQLLALTALTVALFSLVSSAVAISSAGREAQVRLETGAARVITINGSDTGLLLSTVRGIDPDGRYALVAAHAESSTRVPVLALDLSRAGLVDWAGAVGAAQVLRPAVPDPVMVSGDSISVDLDLDARMYIDGAQFAFNGLTLGVTLEDGRFFLDSVEIGQIRPGRATYQAKLPKQCSEGCRIVGFSVVAAPWAAGKVTVRSVSSATGTVTDLSKWHLPGGSSYTVAPVGVAAGGSATTWLLPPDAVSRIPIIPTTGQSAAQNSPVWYLGGRGSSTLIPSSRVGEEPALPRIGASGSLIDLITVQRATAGGLRIESLEVWLTADAPTDTADRLRGAGLLVIGEESRSTALEAESRSPSALTLRMHGVAVIAAIALLLVTVLFIGAGERRTPDLAALRAAGLSRRKVRRAVRGTYLAVVVLGVLLGVGAAALAWLVAKEALPIAERASWLPAQAWPDPGTVLTPLVVVGGVLVAAVYLISAEGRKHV